MGTPSQRHVGSAAATEHRSRAAPCPEALVQHDYHSVPLSYLSRCRLLKDRGILKTRTRGGENERETGGLKKERNKWDRGGGDWKGEERNALGGCGVWRAN